MNLAYTIPNLDEIVNGMGSSIFPRFLVALFRKIYDNYRHMHTLKTFFIKAPHHILLLVSASLIVIALLIISAPSLSATFKKAKPAAKPATQQAAKPTPTPDSKSATTPPPIDSLVNTTIIQNRDSRPSWYFTEQELAEKKEQPTPTQPATSAPLTAICTGKQSNSFDCYQKHYQDIVSKKEIVDAFTDLRGRYDGNAYIKSQCHPITHVIGRAATKKYATVSEAYKRGDSFCWSGYYHGVLEGIVGRIGFEKLSKSMNPICAELATKQRYSFDHYNCVHGLGHGVMSITDNELFESLGICDNLTDSWDRESCWSGAIMENVIVDGKGDPTKYLKPSDPLYPCNAMDAKYRKTCYMMQTSYMLKLTGRDFSKVFELCSGVEVAHRATCYQSLGRDASGSAASDITMTKTTCSLGKTFEQRSNCIIGAAKDFISYFHSYEQANTLCEALDPELQDTCRAAVKSYRIL